MVHIVNINCIKCYIFLLWRGQKTPQESFGLVSQMGADLQAVSGIRNIVESGRLKDRISDEGEGVVLGNRRKATEIV